MTRNDQNLPQPYVPSNETIYGTSDSVNTKDFVIGVLVGGIIGAAAGLLLAPKPGTELRSDAATQAIRLKDKSLAISSTAKDKTVKLSSQLKEQLSKTQKTAPVLDDGTVSSEGEEPLNEFISEVEATQLENKRVEETIAQSDSKEQIIEDISAAARHTSI
jgi:gas vesicle protein